VLDKILRGNHRSKATCNKSFVSTRTPFSYIDKGVRHDITHILYKMAIKLKNRNHICHIPSSLRVSRRVPLVDQKLLILPDHITLLPVFNGVRVAQSLVFCEVFCRSLFVILLRITAFDYPFGIFKLD
jgi:hypothetical protein